MRFLRKTRAFLSYARKDIQKCDALAGWLEGQGIEPVYDRNAIYVGDRLSPTIYRLIDDADCIIALGSSEFMKRPWAEEEVRYAREEKKPYAPVLLHEMPPNEIPEWFTARDRSPSHETIYVLCAASWEPLVPFLKQTKRAAPLTPALRIAITFILLFAVPACMFVAVRPSFGRAAREVRVLQGVVEALNEEIEAAGRGKGRLRRTAAAESQQEMVWRDNETGDVVATDRFTGTRSERHFFDDGRVIATDTIVAALAPDGSRSLRKTRQIYGSGADPLQIEDAYDSVGNLISKRVRVGPNGRWYEYSDLAHSLYPAFLPIYR